MDKYEWLIHTKILEKLWGLHSSKFDEPISKPQECPNGYGNR